MANRRNSREALTLLALLPGVFAGGAHAAHPLRAPIQAAAWGCNTRARRSLTLPLANFQFQPQLTHGAQEARGLILRPIYKVKVANVAYPPAPWDWGIPICSSNHRF